MSAIQLSRCEHEIIAEGAEFKGSSFSEVSLQDSSFDTVTFGGSRFSKVTFETCKFNEVRFDGAEIGKVSFSNVCLLETNLAGLMIEGVPAIELLQAWRAAHPG